MTRLGILAAILLAGCANAVASDLSDEGLSASASAIIRSRDDAAAAQPLGTHHDTRVIVTSRCSDICPDDLIRIVHYDLQPGAACDAVGGVAEKVIVPIGIGVVPQEFCIPGVLFKKQMFAGHPFENR